MSHQPFFMEFEDSDDEEFRSYPEPPPPYSARPVLPLLSDRQVSLYSPPGTPGVGGPELSIQYQQQLAVWRHLQRQSLQAQRTRQQGLIWREVPGRVVPQSMEQHSEAIRPEERTRRQQQRREHFRRIQLTMAQQQQRLGTIRQELRRQQQARQQRQRQRLQENLQQRRGEQLARLGALVRLQGQQWRERLAALQRENTRQESINQTELSRQHQRRELQRSRERAQLLTPELSRLQLRRDSMLEQYRIRYSQLCQEVDEQSAARKPEWDRRTEEQCASRYQAALREQQLETEPEMPQVRPSEQEMEQLAAHHQQDILRRQEPEQEHRELVCQQHRQANLEFEP